MGLSQDEYLKLDRSSMVTFLRETEQVWRERYDTACTYARTYIVAPAILRQDDVIEALVPALKVTTLLTETLIRKRLKEKYWVAYFAALIVDSFWAQEVRNDGQAENQG